jgi:hypothetical protein
MERSPPEGTEPSAMECLLVVSSVSIRQKPRSGRLHGQESSPVKSVPRPSDPEWLQLDNIKIIRGDNTHNNLMVSVDTRTQPFCALDRHPRCNTAPLLICLSKSQVPAASSEQSVQSVTRNSAHHPHDTHMQHLPKRNPNRESASDDKVIGDVTRETNWTRDQFERDGTDAFQGEARSERLGGTGQRLSERVRPLNSPHWRRGFCRLPGSEISQAPGQR